MTLLQKNRMLQLVTPLGENELVLTGFTGRAGISELFSFDLELLSENETLLPRDIVGSNVSFSVLISDDKRRYFNGHVRQLTAGGKVNGRQAYRAQVVPWLWFLTRTTDCRIFQNKSIPQIIEQIFRDLGFADFETRFALDHPTWEYCVQYRESDFHFISRLMELEGIFYFFRHEEGKHLLVLADTRDAYFDCVADPIDFPQSVSSVTITDHITSWEHCWEFRSGAIAQTDYNFKMPSTSLMTNTRSLVQLPGNDKFELYDYPGIYGDSSIGNLMTTIRMEEEEVQADVVHATSTCRPFAPGGRFTIGEHRHANEAGKSYVISSIHHEAKEPQAYETNGSPSGNDATPSYTNSFTCIPESVVFRPPRQTRKPLVAGVQTAVVVGPPGEEIYPDEFGRVKVQFHWDREGQRDEHSSCWIRTSQSVAGKQWGFMAIPRVGQEVVVEFLEGDPDRPLITGSVYNAEQRPPLDLPAARTRMSIKSNSSPGGEGFNELRFDDMGDNQQVFLHAERNLDVRVKNDRMETIDGSCHLTIGGEKRELVALSRHQHVQQHEIETIGGDHHAFVAGERVTTVDQNLYENVGGNLIEHVAGDHATAVHGENMTEAKRVVIKAADEIYLEVGGNFIRITSEGIVAEGKMINLNCYQPISPTRPIPDRKEPEVPLDPEPADNSTSGFCSAPDM